jgi:hypothetical protein
MSNLTNIAIGLIVVGLLLARQMQPRPARETSALHTVLILGVIGIAEIRGAIGSRHLTAVTVAWLALSLLAAGGRHRYHRIQQGIVPKAAIQQRCPPWKARAASATSPAADARDTRPRGHLRR